ncbi:hypothetical protein C3F09_09525 [candidate division GN15 bacterium]|uniref:PilZ domain-containing protein n=1 Tax=candidate division GN15 bacterium TaxID=2072418 RepID=A0A855X4G0_9BACT|nr:MAG: hypothetical protein C3F09_09525 [candidate division GN15 bacterium]
MKDGRKYTRRRASDYLLVTDSHSGQVLGRIINVSPKGLMVMSTQSLAIGRPFDVRIKLPSRAFGCEHLTLTAECRWSSFERRSDLWENGLEIGEISHDNRRILQQVVLRLMNHNGEWGEADDFRQNQSREKLEVVRVRRYRK